MNERTRSHDLAELTVNCARFIFSSLSLSHWEPDLHGSFSVRVSLGAKPQRLVGGRQDEKGMTGIWGVFCLWLHHKDTSLNLQP